MAVMNKNKTEKVRTTWYCGTFAQLLCHSKHNSSVCIFTTLHYFINGMIFGKRKP